MRNAWYALAAAMLSAVAIASTAAAAPDQRGSDRPAGTHYKSYSDNILDGRARKQYQLTQKALQAKLQGKAKGKTYEVEIGQHALLQRSGTDKIFVVLAQFGNLRHVSYPDSGSDGTPQRYDGPLHNQIDPPNRAVDNSTLWQADYNSAHYENMYFSRMRTYYERQSSGRYSIAGGVHGWVQVPFNEARYGRDLCGSIVCSNVYFLIRDAMAYWVKGQLDAGKTMAEIQAYLRTYDQEDRYDVDGDGNFREPDSFIDHFQIVHAGGDQAAGDPHQGTDAIWSHRSKAGFAVGPGGNIGFNAGSDANSTSTTGPVVNPNNPTGIWVGDYTIQPENGGLGVFAHEYAHDLGLPDLYDTSGNTGGAENNTAFWTLMSSGANIGNGGPDGIGDAPTDMGAWEKFQLGWLGCETCDGGRQYDVVNAGGKATFQLSPSANGKAPKGQESKAVFVMTPDVKVDHPVGPPAASGGSWFYWSKSGNDLENSMTRATPGAGGQSITAIGRWDIELDWDYAFIEASTDGGTTFHPVILNVSRDPATDQSGFNAAGGGITGTTGGTWVPISGTLPAGTNAIRVRYQTDGAVAGMGLSIDNIAIGGTLVDGGSETEPTGWDESGFVRINGTYVTSHVSAYVAEYRTHDGYDASLATAYNFGFLDSRPDWVETHPYDEGLLINYWNSSYEDNNVGEHPGEGQLLPVDAHPTFFHSYDGHLLRNRILSYDSAFSILPTTSITVHKNSQPVTIPSQAANPLFDDSKAYWFDSDGDGATGSHVGRYQPGWYSVKVPNAGVQIRVNDMDADKLVVQVRGAR
ncbi:MAG: immune inhibitor A domain-containing protein [Pseudomonadota bacterium]